MIAEKFISIAVDVQKGFCPGGNLAVKNGDKVVEPANRVNAAVKKRGGMVLLSRDWHDENMKQHFEDFPPHCVANTPDAEFHDDLDVSLADCIISKGMDPNSQAFSFLEGIVEGIDEAPEELIRGWHITRAFVSGLALEYCVLAAVLGLRKLGYAVTLVIDATRAVNIAPDADILAIAEMLNAGATIMTTDQAVEFIKAA